MKAFNFSLSWKRLKTSYIKVEKVVYAQKTISQQQMYVFAYTNGCHYTHVRSRRSAK